MSVFPTTLPAWWSEVEALADLLAVAQTIPTERRPPTDHAARLEEAGWRDWLTVIFPGYVQAPFAQRHEEFWAWVWSLRRGEQSAPFIAVWPRGGAKSTSAELACVALGARDIRRYVLYTSATQEQADDHVGNVAALLESNRLAAHYPDLAERDVGKFGNPKGWRRNRVRARAGLTVDAIGLDTAARGVKLDEYRPDLIVFDDVDTEDDSPPVRARKIAAITRKLLPAGASDVAVLAVQNLVYPDSIFAQLVDDRADFLTDRIVSGPFPAVDGLVVEQRPEEGGHRRYVITAGTATWAGQPLDVCEAQIRRWGLQAFLAEAQHEVEPAAGGIFDHLDFRHCEQRAVPDFVRTTVWCDPAVTATDDSDCSAIQADGLAADGTVYDLFGWEGKASPEDVIQRAILKAIEIHALTVGIETDQGGDTWESVYQRALDAAKVAWRATHATQRVPRAGTPEPDPRWPRFTSAKAGQGYGSKAHRASQMVPDYERGEIIHVYGTHQTSERALKRFPKVKPFDLVDAKFWAWADLRGMLKQDEPKKRAPGIRLQAGVQSAWGGTTA
jgi:phage terminase large subunit-like protein